MTRLWAKGTFSGRYRPQGALEQAEAVVIPEFATPPFEGAGDVNTALAAFALYEKTFWCLPIVTNSRSANAIRQLEPDFPIYHEFSSVSSDMIGRGTGTYGELMQVRDLGIKSPLIIAHAHHVGRVALQAKKLGMDPVVPEGLPRMFEKDSSQPWTRSPGLWAIRELLGAPVLYLRGQL